MRPLLLLICISLLLVPAASAQVTPPPTTLDDFFLPGSQPGQSGQLETPSKCDNCHGGYDQAVEPAFNWRGNMMAQAMRDPFFFACMTVCNQDAPDVGDLCIRCHSPAGWLEGRSVPTDGSALNQNDREGVQCDFCHKLVKPTPLGVNPYPGDADYAAGTYPADQSYLGILALIPGSSGNGMYICDGSNAKRGPFVDAVARHQMYYSPFHKDANLCGTCHDVSNPVFSWDDGRGEYWPNSFGAAAPDFDKRKLFPVERTFSEWLASDYNTPTGVYAPQFGGNKDYVATCQDCHMKDVTGVGCNKKGAPVRNDLPLHDMTGGNTFIPPITAQLYPDEVNVGALSDGVLRARSMLQKAATLGVEVTDQGTNYDVQVTVANETGHKLPSGYPEGRRIWVNVRALGDAGQVLYESGAYDFGTGVLTHDADAKVYEIHPGISAGLGPVVNLPAGKSFHFVLNNTVYSDNRIPPRGFTNAAFAAIQSPVVGYTYADGQYWDVTTYSVPAETYQVDVTLYYQSTSKEYVEFLRDENRTNAWGQTLYDLWAANGMSTPEVMASETVVLQAISDTDPPTAPANLAANPRSDTRIDLSWDVATDNVDVVGYQVYRDGSLLRTTEATTYQDDGLTEQTTYSYYVKAYDAAGNVSSASNTATATTKRAKGGGPKGAAAGPVPFFVDNLRDQGRVEISYYLEEAGPVRIDIFDIRGRLIETVEEGWQSAGHHDRPWNYRNVGSGVYMLRGQLPDRTWNAKVTVVK